MFGSLKSKLLSVIAAAFILLLGVLITQLIYELGNMKEQLVKQTKNTMEVEVLGRLEAEASGLSHKISAFLNGLYRVPHGLSAVLAQSSASDAPLSRDQVNQLVRHQLSAHKDISSLYAQFEANGYDNQDEAYRESAFLHSVPDTGVLEVYWLREENGGLVQEPVTDSNDKYIAVKDEFGQREAEWYLCSRDSKKACTLQPYLYEIREGYEELMTSLTVPIMVQGQFRGVVGIDVNLPVIQQLIENLQANLYGGKSRITLLSDLGLIVGSSAYQKKLTRPLSEAMDTLGGQLTALHNQTQSTLFHEGTYYVAYPMPIAASGSAWSLLVELPEEVVLGSTHELTEIMNHNISGMLGRQVLLALIATAIVMLVVLLLVRSIVRPIRQLNERVHNLASHDGDLSKTIEIHTHSELISLSEGFNSFVAKLRVMVNELKVIGGHARQSAQNIKSINEHSAKATSEQQTEIVSVVTATNEMSHTATSVSQLAAEVSANAQRSLETIVLSQQSLTRSVEQVTDLSQEMQVAGSIIADVETRTTDINRILEVIRAIADQTNLLALNAAIEAARAGEQGRGFAVVADEVRTLAAKTQNSTDEINELIGNLNAGVNKAVASITSGTEKADSTRSSAQVSLESLSQVVEDITSIADHIIQVATAAEEQSAVSEEVSRNLTIIGDAASRLAEMTDESSQQGNTLERVMNQLDEQLSSLKT